MYLVALQQGNLVKLAAVCSLNKEC
jgi:hypothetical protein